MGDDNRTIWIGLIRDWAMWSKALRWAEERHCDQDSLEFLRMIVKVCTRRFVEPDGGTLADAARVLAGPRRRHRRARRMFPKN